MKILITGGSGVIGQQILKQLKEKSHQIVVLSRSVQKQDGNVRYALWDPIKGEIEESALQNVDQIINLAGLNLAEGRWTDDKKQKILKSRTESISFLIRKIKELQIPIKSFVSASAIGYYGISQPETIFKEQDPPGSDFLAQVCMEWENALQPLIDMNIRVVVLRTGLVLSHNGGLLGKILPLAKNRLNTNFGNGEQIYPWIHIQDMARIYVFALEHTKMEGVYNACSALSEQVKQKEFNSVLGEVVKKPLILPSIPAFLLKLGLGEKADMLLTGSYVSNEKLIATGFTFHFPELMPALKDLVEKE